MKVVVLLEYGIPHYREFIFDYLNKICDDFLVVHTGEDFSNGEYSFKTVRCKVTKLGISRLGYHHDIVKYVREYDVIIGSFNLWRPMCWLPALLSDKKCILWGQAFGRRDNFFLRAIRRWAGRRADSVLVYTQRGKAYYKYKLGIEDKVHVTQNTLYIPNHAYTNCERRYFLYVGRLQRRKYLTEMFEVMADIKKREGMQGEVFRIVGNGDILDELKQRAKSLGVAEHVNFVGAVYDDNELREHFSGALGYVSPAHVGLGVVHAFSYGIPVITHRTENHAPEFDYCNPVNSYLCNGREELKEVVEKLLKDGSESYKKGRAAYERYDKQLRAEHTQEVFRKAVLE